MFYFLILFCIIVGITKGFLQKSLVTPNVADNNNTYIFLTTFNHNE